MKWTTTTKESVLNGVKIMVYSRAGVGKTMLCATMPRPCIVSAEAGLLSLTQANQRRVFGNALDIPVIKIANVDDLSDAFQFFTESADAKHFDSICLDSISEMAERILSNALRQVKDPRQAYGELLEKCNMMLKEFRDIPRYHVYCAAKMERKEIEDGKTSYFPGMPGNKVAQNISYLFDEVFLMGVGKTPEGVQYRYLQTQPDLQYDAKDRSGALDVIEEPNLSKLIEKILSHV
jgi:hypothetical protein